MDFFDEESISLNDISSIENCTNDDVAVIGIASKTPYGDDVEEFWKSIESGGNLISGFEGQRKKDIDDYLKFQNPKNKAECVYFEGAYLKDIDKFDYKFFNMTPKEAQLMDPCQRLFLENTIKAIEDAGYGGDRLKATDTSIYIGYAGNIKDSYQNMIWNVNPKDVPLSIVNNMNGMMGGRISYLFDLRGVAELIDTTCASSLVAVHSACQAIINGECTIAIAGSVRVSLLPFDNEISRIGVESKDYQTRAFDTNSDGFGVGEGIVTLVLKSLSAAKRDNDDIYAVIKGSAVNQGGNSMGLTVTNPEALTDVVKKAWNQANVDPETIELIEAHGTGTNLGDPIEIKGINDAFSEYTDKKSFCAVGSIKSNLGHLYEASGIIGLLKVILALKNKIIPPTLNLVKPNEKIEFANSALYLNTKARKWNCNHDKRRAMINSLGLNGTNSHMVLEEFINENNEECENIEKCLVLSARSINALLKLCNEFNKFVKANNVNLLNLCYTAALGRWHYNYRVAIKFSNKDELIKKLELIEMDGVCNQLTNNIYYNILEKNIDEKKLNKSSMYLSLQEIINFYINGYEINWDEFYKDYKTHIIHIPTYQFDGERCWLEIPESDKLLKEENFTYQMKWNINSHCVYQDDKRDILLIGPSIEKLTEYKKRFIADNIHCVIVILNESYKKINEDEFLVANQDEDIKRVVNEISNFNIEKVVYILESNKSYEVAQPEEIYEFINKEIYFGIRFYQYMNLKFYGLITTNVNLISHQEEYIAKESAPMISLLKALEKEDNSIKVKIIDKDKNTYLEEVYKELFNFENGYAALRNHNRYVSSFTEMPIKNEGTYKLKEKSCYLVTGGTGSLSLAICNKMASICKSTFVLLNRSKLIEREKWYSEQLEYESEKTRRIIKSIKEIEALGSKVIIRSTDICDHDAMNILVDSINHEVGKINGVIHCAGVGDSTNLKEISIDTIKMVMDPKVKGLLILESIFKNDLEFYMLFSSVATIFTAPMQGAYAAANSYLDSFTNYMIQKNQKVLTINWSTWKEIGMAAENNMTADFIFKALPTQKALGYFERVLQDNSISQVLIGNLNKSKFGLRLIKNSKVNISEDIDFTEDIESSLLEHDVNIVNRSTKDVELKGKEELDEKYTSIEREIAKICRYVLGYKTINVYENFFEMGADSLQIMNIHKEVCKIYPNSIEITDMFSYSNVYKLAKFLSKDSDNEVNIDNNDNKNSIYENNNNDNSQTENNNNDIAIVGIAAKVGNTDSLEEFYKSLLEGQCMVSELPKWRKEFLTEYLRYKNMSSDTIHYTKGTYLQDIDKFDYEYFHLSPREASLIDPHQRLYLETALSVIEDAGYGGGKLNNSNTGVFLGFATNLRDMYSRIIYEVCGNEIADSIVGNTQAVLAGRVSHEFNLKGVSMVIDTACSSSLTALDTAIQFIKSGKINAALVGGIKLIIMPVEDEKNLLKIGMESSDGFTRTFDDNSDGTAFGEGVEMILIKSLKDAIKDRDHIYGVIKGMATNQDGNSAGITAPNPQSQKEVILNAWKEAKINPEEITYVEAHGTGTQLGDTIECKSINEAFKTYTNKKAFCILNTLKPNYGHLSEGSGLFGVIKGLLALKNECIPKNILLQKPNKKINMIDSATYINTRNVQWEKRKKERIFALSNFGMSGTNAHIVIQEYMDNENSVQSKEPQIITLSNKNNEGLVKYVENMIQFIDSNPKVDLGNLSYTLNTGRGHYGYRLAIICSEIFELQQALKLFLVSDEYTDNIAFGHTRLISDDRKKRDKFEIYNNEKVNLSIEANELLSATSNLKEIAKLYVQGADIKWDKFYQNKDYKHVSAPTYQFKKSKCWIEIPKVHEINEDNLYYSTKWVETKRKEYTSSTLKTYLIFYNEQDNYSNQLIKELEKENNVLLITVEDILKNLNSVDDYVKLIAGKQYEQIDMIINMATLGLADEPSTIEKLSIQVIFRLCKALVITNFTRKLTMVTICKYTWQVTEEEKQYFPYGAAMIGLNRVIGLENPNITSYAIDIDDSSSIKILINELNMNKKEYLVCYRENRRFVEEFDKEEIIISNNDNLQIKQDGVYVITGGTGGIGLVLAKYLSSQNSKIKIALISRSDNYLHDNNKLNLLKELRDEGVDVSIYAGDVSDSSRIHEIFRDLKGKYGTINGVVHGAGIASAEILATRSEQSFGQVFDPKYYGTINVFHEIENENVDFFVLCSSSCTLTGEASQGDYVAANTFLDAFTYYANQHGVKTHCINWVSWKSEGMSVRYNINVDEIFKALENDDAIKAFQSILLSNNKKCIIGKLNFGFFNENNIDITNLPFNIEKNLIKCIDGNTKGQKTIEFIPLATKKRIMSAKAKLEGKVEENASYSLIECEIAEIFSKVLGLENVNIYDNFFELGGDSILLGRIHALIEEKYPKKIKLLDLFSYTSVSKIANFIEQGNERNNVYKEIASTTEGLKINDNKQNESIEDEQELEKLLKQFEDGEISADDMFKHLDY